jgi:hypothetical protein
VDEVRLCVFVKRFKSEHFIVVIDKLLLMFSEVG